MAKQTVAPYGSWHSPITSDLIISSTIRLGQFVIDGPDVYWDEMRPSENGRNALVKWNPDHGFEDLSPAGFNVRTRVHEYGGGAFAVCDGDIYFTNFVDQRLYRQYPFAEAEPLTESVDRRYADLIVDQLHRRLICVQEDHSTNRAEAVNSLVAIDLDHNEGEVSPLVSGNDFYAAPRLTPDGRRLAWLTWNHPNMPWDGTELWVADVDEAGQLQQITQVAGGSGESIFQPEWSPAGVLHFVSDRTGWWNLYRWLDGRIEPLLEMEAEFGRPQWVFGMSTYGFESANSIICSYTQDGTWYLARLDTSKGRLAPLDIPYTYIGGLKVSVDCAVFTAASATEYSSLVRLDLSTNQMTQLRRSSTLAIDEAYISRPVKLEFPTEDGLTAHGFLYQPHNPDFRAPAEERPPLIVFSHGGPTSAVSSSLNLSIQYWTSRGFAVLDVNYGGSTGYGRAYRQRLNHQWGIVDVYDCMNGARYLAEKGEVDQNRMAIRGGSAGGYTTLCAVTFHNTFSAGASHFGPSELELFVQQTHKFESRYLHTLLGPYPEQRQLYYDRSPIHFVEQINCPLILFQGLEDKIVLANQTELIYEAIRAKGLPVAYVAFAGEQHGFRQAQNIKRALDGELYFYSKVFDFGLTTPVEPVTIDNLDIN